MARHPRFPGWTGAVFPGVVPVAYPTQLLRTTKPDAPLAALGGTPHRRSAANLKDDRRGG